VITVKEKKCKVCGAGFVPRNSFQTWCSHDCGFQIASKKEEVRKKKKAAVDRKVWEMTNEKMAFFEKPLETEINAIARLIDNKCNCISCEPNTPIKKIFGGHFRSVGSNKTIRYNLHNIHSQCYSCNGNKGGKPIEYEDGLKRIYGDEYAEYVKYGLINEFKELHWTRQQLVDWTKEARKIRSELEKEDKVYTPKQRMELRTKVNDRLKIYVHCPAQST